MVIVGGEKTSRSLAAAVAAAAARSGFWTGRRQKANPKELEDFAGTNGEDATPPSLTTLAVAGTQRSGGDSCWQ